MNRNAIVTSNTFTALLVGFFTFFFCCCADSTSAQGNYQFTTYTQENGLASGTIRGIKKDKTGFIWLMSENGLNRFDGYTFKKFQHNPSDPSSISSNDVRSIELSDDGEIVFNTGTELCKYFYSSSSFKKIISFKQSSELCGVLGTTNGFWIIKQSGLIFLDSKNQLSQEYKFPQNIKARAMHFVTLCDQKIWINDDTSIVSFDPNAKAFSFASITYPNSAKKFNGDVHLLFSVAQKTPYFYSSEGLFKYEKGRNSFINYSNSSLQFTKQNPVNGFLFTGKYVVFSLLFNRIFTINIRTGEEHWIELIKTKNEAENIAQLSNLNKISENLIWVSASTEGIFKVNLMQHELTQISNIPNDRYSLPSNNIDMVMEDGNLIWLVSPGLGLIKAEFLNPIFQTYRPFERNFNANFTLSNNIRTIAELDENNLLVGGLDGLLRFNRTTQKFNLFCPDGKNKPLLDKIAISKIIKDGNGNCWISVWGRDGIFIVSKDGKKTVNINPADNTNPSEYSSLRSMLIDSHGYLWLGTDNNLVFKADVSQFNFDNFKSIRFKKINTEFNKKDSLIFNICFSIIENPKGQVLLGTQSGFYIYDYPSNKFKRFITNVNNSKSISANDVRSIFIDKDGNTWLATNGGGLNLFDDKSGTFKSYTTEDGLADNTIYSILEDDTGILWMGTNKGLCEFNKKDLTCRTFLLKDGIQNYEFNTNSAFKTKTGELIFGGINGFNIFNPKNIALNSTPPKVVITEFKISDNERSFNDQELKLSHNENYVSFQFAALNYYRNSENNYAYKLEGINKDWIYCGNMRFTNFANLSPGSYTFRVKASNSFGIWSEKDALLKFQITTPWYNSLLFYFILLLLISGLIYFIYHYRLQQAIALQAVRNSIARDLHDEIGSNLSSISLFTEVAKEKNVSAESNVSVLLQKISDYTQTSQEAMNDIVWMINARNDRFENIIVRMRGLAVELLEAKNISLHLNFDEKLNQMKMGMIERKNFYLIYKEILNNIVKYAQCANVWIDLTLTHSKVHLKIKDDGKGFDQITTTGGNGLINMKKRTDSLKGEIHIISSKENGTSIELSFYLIG